MKWLLLLSAACLMNAQTPRRAPGFSLPDVKLQQHAFCVLSDSGTLTEESSILDFPGVMLRDAHERPEGMDVGSVIMTGLDGERIVQAIDILRAQRSAAGRSTVLVPDYNVMDVSKKVVRIIVSYCNYVNESVWRK